MPTALPILEIGAVLLAAAAAGWVARRFGLPAVVGYLAVGLVVSPFTPGYVATREHLELLADVGVVLLLFEVGIEIDLAHVGRQHRGLLFAAPGQTILTTLICGAVFLVAGYDAPVAFTIGLAVALSSSVVIVNITRSRRRTTDHPTETALLGWSVLQDVTGVAIAAVLLALIDVQARPVEVALLGLLAFVVLSVIAAAVLPQALRRLHGEPDLFLIVSIAAGLTVAGVGAVYFGIPLALAAFVGGLTVTESGEAQEARRRLRPFRDVFAVLFFVAIGTLLDPGSLANGLGWFVLLAGLLVGAKTLVAFVLGRLARLARPGQVAVGLSQVGEFSFVLATILLADGRIGPELHAALLATVVVSIAVSAVAARLPVRGWVPERDHAGAGPEAAAA